jgi:hypothetical protein
LQNDGQGLYQTFMAKKKAVEQQKAKVAAGEPRRHHYLPQFYLNRFTTNGSLIVYDFLKENKFTTSPQNIAHIRDFYYTEMNDPAKQTFVEGYFSKIESLAKDIIDEFVRTMQLPSEKNWYILSEFIAGMYVRIPHFRFQYLETVEGLMEMFAKFSETPNSKSYKNLQSQIPPNTQLSENFSNYDMAIHQNEYVSLMLTSIPKLTATISQMIPSLLISIGNAQFLTSDNPIILWGPPPKPFCGNGWLTDSIQVYFPLSPFTCLMLRWKNNFEVFPVNEKCVAMANTNLISSATQYVLSSDNVIWMSKDLKLCKNDSLLFKEFAESKKNTNFVRFNGINHLPKEVNLNRIRKSTYTKLQNSKKMPNNK